MTYLNKKEYARFLTRIDTAIGCLDNLKEELLELKTNVIKSQDANDEYFSGSKGEYSRIKRARIMLQQLLVRKIEASLKW